MGILRTKMRRWEVYNSRFSMNMSILVSFRIHYWIWFFFFFLFRRRVTDIVKLRNGDANDTLDHVLMEHELGPCPP